MYVCIYMRVLFGASPLVDLTDCMGGAIVRLTCPTPLSNTTCDTRAGIVGWHPYNRVIRLLPCVFNDLECSAV